jgi:hypothetical protein
MNHIRYLLENIRDNLKIPKNNKLLTPFTPTYTWVCPYNETTNIHKYAINPKSFISTNKI